MKKIVIVAALVGLSFCLVGCDNMTKQDVGVLTGGAVGGLVGSRFGKGGGQVLATAVGAVAGGLIGGQIGKNMDKVDNMKMQRVLENTPTNQSASWCNPDKHTRYTVKPTKTYYRGRGTCRRPCREYTTTAWIGGKKQVIYGTACRESDGSWRIVR